MELKLPSIFRRILRKESSTIVLEPPDLFSDMPEGLKQFLLFALIFLVGGITILFVLAALTMY